MDRANVDRFRAYLWVGQTTLIISLLICALTIPRVVGEEGGVSNFGNHPSTIALYSLGFLTNTVFLWKAAMLLGPTDERLQFLRTSLRLLSIFVLIVFISTFPRHFSFTYVAIHDYVGVALYAYQFVVAIWIVAKRHTVISVSLLVMQALGSLIGLLSVLKVIHLLFVGQAIGEIAFSLLLCLILPGTVNQLRNQNMPDK